MKSNELKQGIQTDHPPVALITGGAKRIGKEISRSLHANGYNVMIHYRSSKNAAIELITELNNIRANSAAATQCDLLDLKSIPSVIDHTIQQFGQLNALINNASTFYTTPIELVEEEFWNDLMGSNLKAPAFLTKTATQHLRKTNGNIINIVDIYADRPLSNHPIYCAAKAGLEMLTKSLARDLAPEIRVNGVAPGAILWPENGNSEFTIEQIIERIPLNRMGEPSDIAKTVLFLITEATYITGQIIKVDGGRSIVI